ncbi:PREDICTED: glutamate receptor ionotropic, NMDA 3A-like [Priapulus caudatus]|uniref:Glutamate receptor ionotropic, NMDA 3A-like n=1 Tax=Priapulus caudatus TaxID=37621 RepID=A0ABM1DV71_PRICU|nr:PREDICTED: glutamate receptor ionotropic, NMDA 3A-like [Priapulus caudatus]
MLCIKEDCISYDRFRVLSTAIANSVIGHCEQAGWCGIVPPQAVKHVFTTGGFDNIDYSPSSTTAKLALYGTCISIHQHFSSDKQKVENFTDILIPTEMGRKVVRSLPASYTTMDLDVSLSNDEVLHVPALRTNSHPCPASRSVTSIIEEGYSDVLNLVDAFEQLGNPFMEKSGELLDLDQSILMPPEVVDNVRKMYPSPTHFASAALNALEENRWYTFSLIADTTLSSHLFLRVVAGRVGGDDKWNVVNTYFVAQTVDYARVADVLGNSDNRARVFVLYCSKDVLLLVGRYAALHDIYDVVWLWVNRYGEALTREDARGLPPSFLVVSSRGIFPMRKMLAASLRRLADAISASRGLIGSEVAVRGQCCGADDEPVMTDALLPQTVYENLLPSPAAEAGALPAPTLQLTIERLMDGGLLSIEQVNAERVTSSAFPVLSRRYPLWRKLRVVTLRVEPFVFVGGTSDGRTCSTGVVCLQVYTADGATIAAIFHDYANERDGGAPYTVHCCTGFSIDLLRMLSASIGFEYEVYLVSDGRFGTFVQSNWTGAVGDVVSRAADIACSALSLTAARSEVIDFSSPFFRSSYSFLVANRPNNKPNFLAFLAPLGNIHPQLWLVIGLCMVLNALCMTSLEWWGRRLVLPPNNRHVDQFNFGSALMHHWALLFNNTVNTEIPKLWSSKLVSYSWAFVSILVLSSYTAHYAALFAASEMRPEFLGVYDSRMQAEHVGVRTVDE